MPVYINDTGTPVQIRPVVNQSGSPTECAVYVNDNGTARQVHAVSTSEPEPEPEPEPSTVIDDFEHNNLSGYYTWDTSWSGDQRIVSRAARSGSYGLELDGYAHAISTTGMGLPNYPNDSRPFEIYVKPAQLATNTQFWCYFGADSGDESDYYSIEVIYDSATDCTFRVRSPSGGHIAEDNTAPIWAEHQWYRLLASPQSDGGWRYRIFEDGSSSALSDISSSGGPSGTFGIGVYCSDNGILHADDAGLV